MPPVGDLSEQQLHHVPNPSEVQFVELLEAHQGLIRKVCRVYARTAEQQRDLFQDIAVQLWRAWPQYRGESKISTWMYRVALNVAISGLRQKTASTETLQEHHQQIPAAETGTNDQITRLYEALHRLSPVEKALALLLLEDYSYDEMSAITGQNINHLRVKTHRLREKLRSLLQPVAAI